MERRFVGLWKGERREGEGRGDPDCPIFMHVYIVSHTRLNPSAPHSPQCPEHCAGSSDPAGPAAAENHPKEEPDFSPDDAPEKPPGPCGVYFLYI